MAEVANLDKLKKLVQNRIFQVVLLLSFTAVTLYFLLRDHFFDVVDELLRMNFWWVLVTIILIFAFWLLKALSTHVLTKQIQPSFKFASSLKMNIIIQFFNSITPFSVGQPIQIGLLKKYDISTTDSTNITIQNFIVYQIAVDIIEVIAAGIVFITGILGDNHLIKVLMLSGLILDVFILLFLFVLAFSKKVKFVLIDWGIRLLSKLRIVKNKEETLANWNQKIEVFHKGALHLFQNKKEFGKAILCNFAGLLLFYLTPLTLVFATGNYTGLSAFQSIYLTVNVIMAADIIPTPGQVGGIEYGFSVLFGSFLKPHVMSAVLIVWRFLSYYLTLIVGGITLNIRKKKPDTEQPA